jgi:hypothetical protein
MSQARLRLWPRRPLSQVPAVQFAAARGLVGCEGFRQCRARERSSERREVPVLEPVPVTVGRVLTESLVSQTLGTALTKALDAELMSFQTQTLNQKLLRASGGLSQVN